VQAVTKLLQIEKQRQESDLTEVKSREGEQRGLLATAEQAKAAMAKRLMQLELEKQAAQLMAQELHHAQAQAQKDSGCGPLDVQSMRNDLETLASYALSLEKRLGEVKQQDEKILRLEATLLDTRQHRRRLEAAFRELHMKQVDMQKATSSTQLSNELRRAQTAIEKLEKKNAYLTNQAHLSKKSVDDLVTKTEHKKRTRILVARDRESELRAE
jgi:hypothetical protein